MVFGWRRQLGVPDTLAKYALSKATGAIVVASLVPVVGTRDIAYQVCLLLWLIPGLLLLFACHSVEADEQAMEEAVMESINEGLVRGSKQRARQEVRSVLSDFRLARRPTGR